MNEINFLIFQWRKFEIYVKVIFIELSCGVLFNSEVNEICCFLVSAAGFCSPDCDKNAYCVDEDGDTKCVCKEGYTGDGLTCEGNTTCLLFKLRLNPKI